MGRGGASALLLGAWLPLQTLSSNNLDKHAWGFDNVQVFYEPNMQAKAIHKDKMLQVSLGSRVAVGCTLISRTSLTQVMNSP
jgi:hypothetical protein